MIKKYKNRHGEILSFNIKKDKSVEVTDFYQGSLRVGMNDDKVISMVDPSGGPYLQIGINLKYLLGDKVDIEIKTLGLKDGKIIING
jgi:hypothetical protein